ncbi:MAG: hypothetical protein ABIP57_00070, partial [Jatrophihabitantaceae bacterium]
QNFAVVLSNGAPYFNDTSQTLKVGDCNWSDCNNIGVGRSYFSFDTTAITRHDSWQNTTAHIFAAKVSPYELHNAAGCTSEPVDLYWAGDISHGATWPGPLGGFLQELSSARGDTCTSSGPGSVDFAGSTVLNRVQSAANSGTTTLTFALISPDPTDRNQWKRFNTNPQLTVTYNFPPSAPQANGITGSVQCNGSVYVADSTPQLNGQAHDNNSPHTALDLDYNVYPIGGGNAVASSGDVLEATAAGGVDRNAPWNVNRALSDGAWKYTVSAHFDSANFYIDIPTGESGPYPFVVEATPPQTMPLITSADYPSKYWGTASGKPGAFLLNANGGQNARGFAYAFDSTISAPTTCAPAQGDHWMLAPSGNATLTAPSSLQPGPHTLTVRTFNDVHALSSQTASYQFYVSPSYGGQNRVEAESPSLTYADGPSQTMTDLYRYVGGTDHASAVGGTAPGSGYGQESALGMLSTTTAPGMRQLWDCMIGTDHFTSSFADCEGRTVVRSLGYIYINQPNDPPTHAVYRCVGADHFDSTSATCEGHTVEYTLGYAMDMPSSGSPTQTNAASGYQMQLIPTAAVDDHVTINFTVTTGADYAIGVELNSNNSNGIIDFSADGTALGQDGDPGPVDTSSSTPVERYLQLGGAHLEPGAHTLTLKVNAPGSNGGGYQSGLDYLTLAPVNNATSTPNNDGISNDNETTAANFNSGGAQQSLSEQALAAAGLGTGSVATVGGTTFTMGPSIGGLDNTMADGTTLKIDHPRNSATYVDLLVASTGAVNPSNADSYVISIAYGDGALDQDRLPAVPLWTTSNTSVAPSNSGVTCMQAVVLDHYNAGPAATRVSSPAYLYLLKVSLSPDGEIQSITLPNDIPGSQGRLHVLAVTTS